MRVYWIQLEELDMKLLPGMGVGGQRALGESHAGRVYVDTHTFNKD